MIDSAIFAFLHHVAAFTMVAALAIEFVLIRGELTVWSARRIQVADIVYGASATVLVIVGFLRVFYFEKGYEFYFASGTFVAKISLFVLVAALSAPPTVEFLKWRQSTAAGNVPLPDPKRLALIRRLIHIGARGRCPDNFDGSADGARHRQLQLALTRILVKSGTSKRRAQQSPFGVGIFSQS